MMTIYKEELLLPNNLYPVIGHNIRRLRKQACMTQEMLAESINCEQKQISKIETGKARAGLATYLRIANVFQVSIDNLLIDLVEVEMKNHTGLIEALSGKAEQQLTQDMLKAIFRYLSEKV